MNQKVLIGGGLALILILFGGLMLYNQQNSPESPTTQDQAPTLNQDSNFDSSPSGQSTPSAVEAGDIVNFTVEGSNFKFVPNALTVKTGDKVKITFKNISGIHDFQIDGLNINTPVIQSGEDAVVEFTATKTGTFEFYCSVGNHRAQGMKGTLNVL